MNKLLKQEDVVAICSILADKNNGFTKSELKKHLSNSHIQEADDRFRSNGLMYSVGLNKKDWLYNCFAQNINTSKSCNCVF